MTYRTNIKRKKLIDYRLDFTLDLAYYKGQVQAHAYFDCENLANSNRYEKYCYCQCIGSLLLAFNWCIYM